jgi:RNA polymerase sigma-B factor
VTTTGRYSAPGDCGSDVLALHERYAASRSRDLEAELLGRHERIAVYLARRFAGRGEAPEDLRQVALLALLRALRSYDPGRGTSFSAYAVPSILGELRRHFRDRGWLVRPPRHIQEAYLLVRATITALEAERGRPPTPEEIAERTALSVDDVLEGLAAACCRHGVPLTSVELLGHDDLNQEQFVNDDAYLASVEDVFDLQGLLGLLPEAEHRVVTLSFFTDMTQEQIAARLGISKGTVSRMRTRAINRLRALEADRAAVA